MGFPGVDELGGGVGSGRCWWRYVGGWVGGGSEIG
jgi:hypothetical protein